MSGSLAQFWNTPVNLVCTIISLVGLTIGALWIARNPKLFRLVVKNLRRNLLRTSLTSGAIIVLVLMATMIWTLVSFLDRITTEKARNFKMLVTERYQVPSMMPLTHANYVNPGHQSFLKELKDLNILTPDDFMVWSFYGGTVDKEKKKPEDMVFFFCLNPDSISTMMDDLDNLDPKLLAALKSNRRACLLGPDQLRALNLQVPARIKLWSINYKGIDLELDVVGTLPEGRYAKVGVIQEAYFNEGFDKYRRDNNRGHPLENKRINLIWLRVPDREAFDKIGTIIKDSPLLKNVPVKVETESAGLGNFMEGFQTLLLGMKFIVVPGILVSMALVIANAISISVRERRTEMAVLKVLGFSPGQILGMVLAESMLVGAVSGLVSILTALFLCNFLMGGVRLTIAFFPAFPVPDVALAWGLATGLFTGFLGSFLPAWTARSVKVSEVFAKVA